MIDLQYEAIRSELERIAVPDGEVRQMNWLQGPLGVGRIATGEFEVFIRGECLEANSSLVRQFMEYGSWRSSSGGEAFAANRIALPEAQHYASIAALISIELLRAGIDRPSKAQSAFSDVEPIIEMAIRRGALPENVVVGLIGELILLRQLLALNRDQPYSAMRILDCWLGWQDTARDFRLGSASVEVKTTTSVKSIHQFSGLRQIEPEILPSGELEKLYIFSIGLSASTQLGESLPQVVSSILALMQDSSIPLGVSEEFLFRLERYGHSPNGYNHSTMKDWASYSTCYAHTFSPRLYRLDDPFIKLLTRSVIAGTFVQPDDLSFKAHFPDQVSTYNPSHNWEQDIRSMLQV